MKNALLGVRTVGLVALGLVVAAPPSRAQDQEAVAQVLELNKKAIEAYDGLDMDGARKLLTDALRVCAERGLDSHKVKARTHLNLGVVAVAGLGQKDFGVAQFVRALAIDPAIAVPKNLSNPEVDAAFAEARAQAGSAAPPPPPPPPPPAVKGVEHEPVTEAEPEQDIEIVAKVAAELGAERVVLAYRPEGAADYLARDMKMDAAGNYVARIPEPATRGAIVAYYIEARSAAGAALANNGSPQEPHVISLGIEEGVEDVEGDEGDAEVAEEAEAAPGARKLWFSLGVGTGFGFVKGNPEVITIDDRGTELNYNGGAPSGQLVLAPEFGFFVRPNLALSLQGRLQKLSGASSYFGPECPGGDGATMDGECTPAKGAIVVLAKATWFFGATTGRIQPYFSLAAGAGQIRYLVTINTAKTCGVDQDETCKDTLAGGKVFLGPGGGILVNLSRHFGLTLGANALVGLPSTAINVDVAAGVAVF